jgi:hypothetical protein
MDEYQNISIEEFQKLSKSFEGKKYELEGLARAVISEPTNDRTTPKNYTVSLFLQKNKNMALVFKDSNEYWIDYNTQFLRAASEGNLEFKVQGTLAYNGQHNMLKAENITIGEYQLKWF